MKALVLSGGKGTRLRPFSYSMPKQLIPIANRPLLEHVLANIRDLGVTEVGIVVGDWVPKITETIGDGSRFGVRVTYIQQDQPLGLAHCVRIARPFLGDDDFVMYLGDNFLAGGIGELAGAFRADRPAAHVAVRRVPDPRSFGVVELDEDGAVRRLVEKPTHPRSDLAMLGVYFFTAAVHEAVEAIRPSARGELEITDAIQLLLTRGATVTVAEYGGFWRDVGRVEDVLECNRHALGGLRPSVEGEVDDASELTGEVVLGPGAKVLRSRIHGPAIVGPGTVIEDSHVGPHSSIGRDCVLRGSRVADSVVLDGASILWVHGVRASLIGRSATVGSSRTHHRLVVGDHARIEMAA